MIGKEWEEFTNSMPTLQMSDADVPDTPVRLSYRPPAGLGLGTTFQDLPL
jgi:hypothetical protein